MTSSGTEALGGVRERGQEGNACLPEATRRRGVVSRTGTPEAPAHLFPFGAWARAASTHQAASAGPQPHTFYALSR